MEAFGLFEKATSGFGQDGFGEGNRLYGVFFEVLSNIQKTVGRDTVLNMKKFIADIGKEFNGSDEGAELFP